jgi:oxalate decarboxylase/phosphoglucose isomerase-like protein (cupin superfamily)
MPENEPYLAENDERLKESFENDGSVVPEVKVIKYVKPEMTKHRHVFAVARTDALHAMIHVWKPGRGNKLHSHPNLDGLWFVLGGRAGFYTWDDELVAELGPGEGILIPRDFAHYYRNIGTDELEIMQMEALLTPGERMQVTMLEEEEVDRDFEITQL